MKQLLPVPLFVLSCLHGCQDDKFDINLPNPAAEPNSGRGADLGRYSWTQNLSEVTVMVPVPPGTKGRDLAVVIGKQRIRVGLKGVSSPIVEGSLSEAIKADDSLWNLGGWVRFRLGEHIAR